MVINVESVMDVNGTQFRLLPHDQDAIRANKHPGIPHIWHGVSDKGTSGIFATVPVYNEKNTLVRYSTIKVM